MCRLHEAIIICVYAHKGIYVDGMQPSFYGRLVVWFWWYVKLSWIILCLEVRELPLLYINIYNFV